MTRYVYVYLYSPSIYASAVIATSTPPHYYPAHCSIWSAAVSPVFVTGKFSGHPFAPIRLTILDFIRFNFFRMD